MVAGKRLEKQYRLFCAEPVNEKWVNFRENLNYGEKLFVSLHSSRFRSRPKWMNRKSRVAQKYKSRLWKKQQ